jgi:hypothetical protein
MKRVFGERFLKREDKMTEDQFKGEMKRVIETWSQRLYPAQRVEMFWTAFREVSAPVFQDAVADLIANNRVPPMLEAFQKAVDISKIRATQGKNRNAGIWSQLDQAADLCEIADKEYVRACSVHRTRFLEGKISRESFFKGCDELDSLAATIMRAKKAERREAQKSGRDYQARD